MQNSIPLPVSCRRFPKKLLVLVFLCFAITASAQSLNVPSESVRRQIGALLQEKATRSPAQRKMDSQLIYAAKQLRDGFINQAVPHLRASVKVQADHRVKVDIDAIVSDDILRAIEAAGGKVIGSFPDDRSIGAMLPLEKIESLAAREDVRFIAPAQAPMANTGSINSEGDVAHRSNQARATYGATGAGIKVGVISTSIDNGQGALAASKASGDVPNNLVVLPGQAGPPDGEGLAMCEIVHDLAPAAALYFATALDSVNFNDNTANAAIMAKNIRDLAAAGCKVIIDDINFPQESPFQDGVISKAVNDVSAAGVLFFSCARNAGNQNDGTSSTWEGDFVDGGDASGFSGPNARLHAFLPDVVVNKVTTNNDPNHAMVDLFWSDPLAHSNNDYDLFIADPTNTFLKGSSTNAQDGTQDPYEHYGQTQTQTLEEGDYVIIVKFAGAARFIHVDIGRGHFLTASTAGCIRGHNASGAPNAFCVAATDAQDRTTSFTGGAANPVESFSSDGPRRVFFNAAGVAYTPGNLSSTGGIVLQKPDITAADGGATTVPNFAPFYGTSAAAPHAGAIAAQILSYQPSLTPAQVRAALKASCLNIEAAGFDRDSGSGIVMALSALQSLGPVWKIAGVGDFNSDRKPDILWQHAAGSRLIWLLNGVNLIRAVNLGAVSPAWSIAGAGNFNSDLKSDIVWQHTSGVRSVWLMNNTSFWRSANLATVSPSWQIIDTGFFNGDGKSDLLWHHSSGTDSVWLMNGTRLMSSVNLPNAGAAWKIAAAGDFNGDHKSDLLWQSTSGARAIWLMNGASLIRSVSLGSVAPAWNIVGSGDFNGDGKTDILWQHNSGSGSVWLMNGTSFVRSVNLP